MRCIPQLGLGAHPEQPKGGRGSVSAKRVCTSAFLFEESLCKYTILGPAGEHSSQWHPKPACLTHLRGC